MSSPALPRALEIWSGGQTGVDRAALDVALELGFPIAGWIPRGRAAEDGRVPMKYSGLREADSPDYAVRTHLNVDHSDATLILSWGSPTGGTRETVTTARRLGRPILELDLAATEAEIAATTIHEWVTGLARPEARPLRVNVAGPRASQAPEAYARAVNILRTGLRPLTVHPALGPPDPRFRLAGLGILLLACMLEVATLYLLIAVETPVTPLVRRLMRNPFGLFTVVIISFGVVVAVMTTMLTVLERRAARR